MAHSQQGGFAGQSARFMEGSGEDLRALASVLQDIMPVLARIQTRSTQSPGLGFPGQTSVETAAAVALVSDLGADSLRRLTAYLDANAEKFQGLESCAPFVASAARALAARDYAQAFTHLFEVYRIIAVLRSDDPAIPTPGSIALKALEKRASAEVEAEREESKPERKKN